MTDYREVLRLASLGLNYTQIAESAGTSRKTVRRVLDRAGEAGVDWVKAQGMPDKDLACALYPSAVSKGVYKMPDCEAIHREMAKPGVTLQLVWMEYCEQCRTSGDLPYQLSQFKKLYRDYAIQTRATMHIAHKPGEIMEVDWAGQRATVVDNETGECLEAYLFVAVLPYSGYAYAEAFFSMAQESWIAGHVNAYRYFGGVTRILVPDNLKTGVEKNTKEGVLLNRTYHEMAEHYGTAVIPTRVRAPKDKATVEGAVGNLSTHILAAVRNERFFALRELNSAIHERLRTFNQKPFQRKEGSRATLFAQEKPFLLPLPNRPYELAEWRIATVQLNYHIRVADQYYSVPFAYSRRKVDVRMTRGVVEIFSDGARIASHVRRYGPLGQYATVVEHMPPKHQQYQEWTGDRFRRWAAQIGSGTAAVVEYILTAFQVEQQGFRGCLALLKLADQYSKERLESACVLALTYTSRPSYKSIQTILKSGQDIRHLQPSDRPDAPDTQDTGFTRGAQYYDNGGRKEC
jgi:transposase